MNVNPCNHCDLFNLCQGRYLEDSAEFNGRGFSGCKELEEALITEGLVKYDSLVNIDTDGYKEVNSGDGLNLFDLWEIIIDVKEDNNWDMDYLLNIFHITKKTPQSDINSKTLDKLIHSLRYQNDPHLLFCAFLIHFKLNDPKVIKKLFPGYNMGHYYKNQSRIYVDLDEFLPERIKFAKLSMRAMSKKQTEAVNGYIINNDKKLSMERVSKRLGISKSSLKERLDNAGKKARIVLLNYKKIKNIIKEVQSISRKKFLKIKF